MFELQLNESKVNPVYRLNCNIHPERTAHSFNHCNSATTILNQLTLHVNSYLQGNEPQEQIQIILDTVLFHQTTTIGFLWPKELFWAIRVQKLFWSCLVPRFS